MVFYRIIRNMLVLFGFSLILVGCASSSRCHRAMTKSHESIHVGPVVYGVASWYGRDFHGKKTASGERFSMKELTAAHRTLPFGTILKVTNLSNNQSVQVRVNDRGPFIKSRVLDLSYAAAKILGYVGQGSTNVAYQIVREE